jgi:hypothetical protein
MGIKGSSRTGTRLLWRLIPELDGVALRLSRQGCVEAPNPKRRELRRDCCGVILNFEARQTLEAGLASHR